MSEHEEREPRGDKDWMAHYRELIDEANERAELAEARAAAYREALETVVARDKQWGDEATSRTIMDYAAALNELSFALGDAERLLSSPDPTQDVIERLRVGEAAINALREAVPEERVNGYWCPTCKRYVCGVDTDGKPWTEVAFDLRHEHCGTTVTDGPDEDPWVVKARDIIVAYDKAVNPDA